ncbi:MAG: lytic transglycosylase domain-containing protein [Nanoarchaeota archaeon]
MKIPYLPVLYVSLLTGFMLVSYRDDLPKITQSKIVQSNHVITTNTLFKLQFFDTKTRFSDLEKIAQIIDKSGFYDPDLLIAVAVIESSINPAAQSNQNAQGLLQILPLWKSTCNIKDLYLIEDNITCGIYILEYLLTKYNGDLFKVLTAYNKGEYAVDKEIPFTSSKYAKDVLGKKEMLKRFESR